MTVSFFVVGIPKPQGSKKAFVRGGRAQLVESAGQPLKDWRADVRAAALDAMGDGGPLVGPLFVHLDFVMPRPKSARKRDVYPATRPDVDKLARGALDALTGVMYGDDGQVVSLAASKVLAAAAGDRTGARITVRPMTTGEQQQ